MVLQLVIVALRRQAVLFDEMVVELAQKGPAPSSWRNLKTHARKYRTFCELLSIAPFPLSEQNLCRYMAFLTFTLTSADSVLNYLSGLKKLHGFAKIPFPKFSAYVDLVYQGVKRLLAHQVNQAEPITPQILKRIAQLVDRNDQKQVVTFTAMVVGFYLFLRSSNLTTKTQSSFDPNKNLCRGDIRLAEKLALIEIRWSKTIQYFQRRLLFPIVQILDNDICPIAWLHRMVTMVKASSTDPAFCLKNRNNELVPLTYRQLSDQLKKWVQQIGLPAHKYSPHGLRHGGATFAFESDIATQTIMLLGDWASDSFRRYIHQNLESRLVAMTQMSQRCVSL